MIGLVFFVVNLIATTVHILQEHSLVEIAANIIHTLEEYSLITGVIIPSLAIASIIGIIRGMYIRIQISKLPTIPDYEWYTNPDRCGCNSHNETSNTTCDGCIMSPSVRIAGPKCDWYPNRPYCKFREVEESGETTQAGLGCIFALFYILTLPLRIYSQAITKLVVGAKLEESGFVHHHLYRLSPDDNQTQGQGE